VAEISDLIALGRRDKAAQVVESYDRQDEVFGQLNANLLRVPAARGPRTTSYRPVD
jgi:hypothetical protein